MSEDNSLSKKIEEALRHCLPILAKLEERITHISATAIAQTMLKKFQEINIKRFDGVVVAGTPLHLDVYHDNSVLYVHKNRRWVQFTRREIAAVLGGCLQLSESTIEQFKTLINTATQEELDDALQIFGIDVPEYQTLDQLWVAQMDVLASQMAQINLQDPDVTGAERDQAPTESVTGQQTRQAAPLIHTPISLVKTGARGSSGGAHSDSRAALHGQKRGALFANTAAPERIKKHALLSRGKLGEQKFYDYLLAAAQKMGWQIEETVLGFTAQNAASCLCVEWPNKREESFQSIDFKITYHSQVYMFEVKSSKYDAAKKKFLNLSTNERENLVTYKNRYALVCVFAVESANPKVSIIWNPLKKIIQNSMKPDSMILRWGYNSFEQLLSIPNEATMAEFTEEEPVDYRSCMMQIS